MSNELQLDYSTPQPTGTSKQLAAHQTAMLCNPVWQDDNKAAALMRQKPGCKYFIGIVTTKLGYCCGKCCTALNIWPSFITEKLLCRVLALHLEEINRKSNTRKKRRYIIRNCRKKMPGGKNVTVADPIDSRPLIKHRVRPKNVSFKGQWGSFCTSLYLQINSK